MVRIIAGTLVDVGTGKIPADLLPEIIASRDRERAGHTAPPQGLYMAEVFLLDSLNEEKDMSDRITERPGWDEYFMEMAEVARKRSTCLRRAVGAIIVKDNRILATGYNGVPSGIEHCSVRGCQREALHVPSGERHELCRGIHAEQNAIVQAAYLGVSIDNATLYCTNQPCILCGEDDHQCRY